MTKQPMNLHERQGARERSSAEKKVVDTWFDTVKKRTSADTEVFAIDPIRTEHAIH